LVGLVAVALMQVSVAAHSFSHVADDGLTVCRVCGSYNQLENAPVACAQPIELPHTTEGVADTRADPCAPAIVAAPYWSRAPPLS
jgi:hypothetical protein